MMQDFSANNLSRCDNIFMMQDHGPEYFVIALAEEVGEVAGVYKRFLRGFTLKDAKKLLEKMRERGEDEELVRHFDEAGIEHSMDELSLIWESSIRKKLLQELSDVFIYWDLLRQKEGLTAEDIINTYNKVNEDMGFRAIDLYPETTEIKIK